LIGFKDCSRNKKGLERPGSPIVKPFS